MFRRTLLRNKDVDLALLQSHRTTDKITDQIVHKFHASVHLGRVEAGGLRIHGQAPHPNRVPLLSRGLVGQRQRDHLRSR